MDQNFIRRIEGDRPSEPLGEIFWYIDQINRRRRCGWSPKSLEPDVRQLANHVEEFYVAWLREKVVRRNDDDLSEYLCLVLPYLSYRLLNAPASKDVDLFKVSSLQKRRFISLMLEELLGIPDSPLTRALMRESLSTFLAFLDTLLARHSA